MKASYDSAVRELSFSTRWISTSSVSGGERLTSQVPETLSQSPPRLCSLSSLDCRLSLFQALWTLQSSLRPDFLLLLTLLVSSGLPRRVLSHHRTESIASLLLPSCLVQTPSSITLHLRAQVIRNGRCENDVPDTDCFDPFLGVLEDRAFGDEESEIWRRGGGDESVDETNCPEVVRWRVEVNESNSEVRIERSSRSVRPSAPHPLKIVDETHLGRARPISASMRSRTLRPASETWMTASHSFSLVKNLAAIR